MSSIYEMDLKDKNIIPYLVPHMIWWILFDCAGKVEILSTFF